MCFGRCSAAIEFRSYFVVARIRRSAISAGSGSGWYWHALHHTMSRMRGGGVAERHQRAGLGFHLSARSI